MMEFLIDWYYAVVDFFLDIDFSSITGWISFDGFSFGGAEVNSFALALSLGTGLMMAYFWIEDPMNMGMSTVPLYLRLMGIVIATIVGYVMASKMIEG